MTDSILQQIADSLELIALCQVRQTLNLDRVDSRKLNDRIRMKASFPSYVAQEERFFTHSQKGR